MKRIFLAWLTLLAFTTGHADVLAGLTNPTSSRGNDGHLLSRDGGYTAVASGTATHIYVYVHSNAANGAKIRAGIFDISTGALLAQTSEYTWNTGTDTEPKWLALELESTYPIVAATAYHIGVWTDGSILRWGADNSAGDAAYQDITYSSTFPDPADISEWDGGLAPTFYIEGTTGGGGPDPIKNINTLQDIGKGFGPHKSSQLGGILEGH